ncbi:MAG: ATP-grasp domain-containing protein [Bdellovibrionaceae bacterium]|nr:ATP-grasp domain-containing protein [Pseudobdellovibrionaceae bacterium]
MPQRLAPSLVYHDQYICPAQRAGAEIVTGAIADISKLRDYFGTVESFAIESEFLDVEAIFQAWEESQKLRASKSILPIPSAAGLKIAQDKLEQKNFFSKNRIPSSEYIEIQPEFLNIENLENLQTRWNGFVLKKSRMGYDGKGNLAIPPRSEIALKEIISFCADAYSSGSRVYAERFVEFSKEVALVSCQTFGGDLGFYPLIETIQKKGVCYLAYKALGEDKNEVRAQEIAAVIARKLNLLGTFAVEFFVTQSGDLLVNEIAPRVHNSGHFSQQASKYSQFQLHLKAYWQKRWEPDDFSSSPAFAMINLLGPEGLRGPVSRPKTVQSYWYDKDLTTPGRKLGHIIVHSEHVDELPALIDSLVKLEVQWQESLRANE